MNLNDECRQHHYMVTGAKHPGFISNKEREAMKFRFKNHIVGKVYDLTQDNMNEMIKTIEDLNKAGNELTEKVDMEISILFEAGLKGSARSLEQALEEYRGKL